MHTTHTAHNVMKLKFHNEEKSHCVLLKCKWKSCIAWQDDDKQKIKKSLRRRDLLRFYENCILRKFG